MAADFGWTFAELKNEPNYLLQLAFDDVDNDVFVDELGRKPTEEERKPIEQKYKMMSDEQANKIAEFYFKIRNKAKTIICQCEHGQSRSAAVAAAILEYESAKGIEIFADDDYYPNKVIFKKVLKYLKITGLSQYGVNEKELRLAERQIKWEE
ncbi:MAG: hypothetical protein IJB48_00380 [Clostridia bacterium]|nr:hypothetical protein [Clostridia bacterium]